MEDHEVTFQIEKEKNMENTLRSLTEAFNQNGIEYFIIGSLARNSYMNKDLQSPEIDLLIPDKAQREKAEKHIKEIQANNPEIYLDTSLSELVNKNNGNYSLDYGNIHYEVKAEIFEANELDFKGVKFNSLKSPALLHAYAFVGGPFRKKDWSNALKFARWMKEHKIDYDHNDYSSFHKFGKDRWTNSPLRRLQSAWRNTLNSLSPNIRKVILDAYGSKPIESIRQLYNLIEKETCGTNVD